MGYVFLEVDGKFVPVLFFF